MRRPSRLLALQIALIAITALPQVAVGSTTASTPGASLPAAVMSRLPGWALPQVEELAGSAEELRTSLWNGSLEEGLATVLHAGDVRHEQPDPAVGGLAGLISAATDGIARLGPAPASALADAFAHAPKPVATRHDGAVGRRFSPALAAMEPAPPSPAPPGSVSAEAAAVALRILSEIDAVLGAQPSAPVASGAVDGCDIRDLLPVLCIGGSMSNRYTQDAAILIDLGGDDQYLNSAGGAPFVPPGQTQGIPVSVNVDLGAGNDTYTATRYVDAGATRGVVAQGASAGNAVGILVDEGGNDVYSAPAPSAAAGISATSAIVQGAGSAGILTERPVGGIGALIDLAGNDRYVAHGSDDPAAAALLSGQAFSSVGTGLLVDRGQGDDVYLLDGGTAEIPAEGPVWNRTVRGQGHGGIGGAVLADDGGSDSFRIAATVRRLDRRGYPEDQSAPIAHLIGQGIGGVGPGYLLEGQGPTSYEMVARNEGYGWNRVQGQGFAGLGGAGLLEDLGGNDRYLARATQEYELDVVVDDTCVTKDEGGQQIRCPFADVNVDGYRPTITEEIHVQGFAWLGVVGMVRDHGGNDAYEASAESKLDVSVQDALSEPTKPPDLYVRGFDTPIAWAQGGGNTGVGLLVDDAGSDSYTARSRNETTARATSERADGEPRTVARSRIDGVWMIQQGAGAPFAGTFGGLYDLGGSGDTLLAEGINRTHTEPNPDGAFSIGEAWPHQHGNDHGALVVLGSAPRSRSIPSKATCGDGQGGVRGFGSWTDCTSGVTLPPAVGGGTVPNATGAAPTLGFTAETPATAPLDLGIEYDQAASRIPVGLRVTLPGGAPAVGEPVQLWLQYRCTPTQPPQLPGSWSGAWRVDAVTGEDGVARARMPLLFTGDHVGRYPACGFDWRILGIFGGSPGAYPAQLASPLDLT